MNFGIPGIFAYADTILMVLGGFAVWGMLAFLVLAFFTGCKDR